MMAKRDGRQLSEAEARGAVLGSESLAKAMKARATTRRTQALLAAAAEAVPERRWAIVKVAARRDNDVDNLLSRAMIDHWLPLRKADQPHHGGRKGVASQPVWTLAWPGYVFVKMADTAEAWQGIASVKHTLAILGVGEHPFFLDDDKFLKLKAELATLKPVTGPQAMVVEGQRVMVTDGPFAFHQGTVRGVDMDGAKGARARVEVMLFGRAVPIELDLAHLAK